MIKLNIIILFSTIAILFTGCSDSKGNELTVKNKPDGSVLIAYKGYIYLIGGTDSNNIFSNQILYAVINNDGSTGEWQIGTSLPSARAYHSCIIYDDKMYIIGGKNEDGNSNEIWFAYINSNGQLGFKNSSSDGTAYYKWEKNPRNLPFKISGASASIYDGIIYLLGGETGTGLLNEVLYAKIWRDGQVGVWYSAKNKFNTARKGCASAVVSGKLYISGGVCDTGYLDDLQYVSISGGFISEWAISVPFPESKAYHFIHASSEGLTVTGGFNDEEYSWEKIFYFSFKYNMWAEDSAGLSSIAIISNGYIYGLAYKGDDSYPYIKKRDVSIRFVDAPSLSPGSGLIKSGAKIKITGNPGDTIRYTTGNSPGIPDPTIDSNIYSDSQSVIITGDLFIKARAFRDGYKPSPVVLAKYYCRSESTFLLIKDSIYPSAVDTGFLYYTLDDTTDNDVSSVWLKLVISENGSYRLSCIDSTSGVAGSNTSSVMFSILEGDFYTIVNDADGKEIYRKITSSQSSVVLELSAGEYYLLVESSDGTTGGGFGMSLISI